MVDGDHYDRGLRRFLSGVSRRPCSCVDPYVGRVGIFGAITANLASLLLKSPDNQNQLITELVEEVRELRREMRLRY